MIKNLTVMELKTGERTHQFLCECSSPLGEVYDALSNMRSFIAMQIQAQEETIQKDSPSTPEPEADDVGRAE